MKTSNPSPEQDNDLLVKATVILSDRSEGNIAQPPRRA